MAYELTDRDIGIAYVVAKKYGRFDYDEALSSALFHLFKLSKKYDPSRGAFSTFAFKYLPYRVKNDLSIALSRSKELTLDHHEPLAPEAPEFLADEAEKVLRLVHPFYANTLRRVFGVGVPQEDYDEMAARDGVGRAAVKLRKRMAIARAKQACGVVQ